MKHERKILLNVAILVIALCMAGVTCAAPMGTAFTYQGRLMDANSPAEGLYDFEFELYDDPDAGSQQGSTVDVNDLDVIDGYFTVKLDFGVEVFHGDDVWLHVGVRPGEIEGDNSYVALSPHQEITPVPYALALPGLWTQQNATSTNLVGGYSGNSVTAGAVGATISGGGENALPNKVADDYGTVSGGRGNQAGDDTGTTSDARGAVVGGGVGNTASDYYATVGGGYVNEASGRYAAIGGGRSNESSGWDATVGGGYLNTASGAYATVPGGRENSASGYYSFTAGRRAKTYHHGTFVWADWTDADFASTGSNQFLIRASGGVGIGTTSPQAQLQVGDTSTGHSVYVAGPTTGQSAVWFYDGSLAGGMQYTFSTDDLLLYTAGTAGLTIDSTGNVGIGTLGPSAKLTVNGAILRDGSTMYGANANTHINLGTSSETGTDGQNYVGATVGGGESNTASSDHATVGGGYSNGASNSYATVGGGKWNIASDYYSTVGGGCQNTASSDYATVCGGDGNIASGNRATVPGGTLNTAGGTYSFAAGRRAKANHQGAFVWADSTSADFTSTGNDQFLIRASGGVGIGRAPTANDLEVEGTASKTSAGDWLANSDARIKTDIETVSDALETLDKVRLVSFNYTDDYQTEHPSIEERRYLNVIAQEFAEVFPDYVKSSKDKLPNGDEILQVDSYPLTVYSAAAVQELHAIVKAKDAEIAAMKERLAKMEAAISQLIESNEGGQL